MLPRVLLLLGLGATVSFAYRAETLRSTNATRPAVFCYINGTRLLHTPHFNLQHLKADLCTHIVYAAAVLDYHSWGIKSIDSDLQNQHSVSGNKISFNDIVNLKNSNSRGMDLKILLSVTGNPADFSNMARNYGPQFVQNAATFIANSGFDGLNIDWRFPTRRGGQPQDRDKFTELMKDLKGKIRASGKILTASLSPLRQTVMEAYDIASNDMMECVDYWFVLAFEYYGHWSYAIGANAPIRSREKFGVEKTINDLTDLFGSNSYRLILTIPFYGKKYQLRESLSSSSESPMNLPFMNTAATPDTSSLTYREICQRITDDSWRQGWDSDGQVPYIVKDTSVIVYDDAQSVAAKTRLALRKGLGGVMAFSIDMDDYLGNCMEKFTRSDSYVYSTQDRSDRKFPLLQSMFDTVQRGPNSAAGLSGPWALCLMSVVGATLVLRTRGYY